MHITVPINVCLGQHKNLKALGLVKPKLSHFYKSHQKQKCHDKKKKFECQSKCIIMWTFYWFLFKYHKEI